MNCFCYVHLHADKERVEKDHQNPLSCLGHGGDCPCSLKAQQDSAIIKEAAK